MCTLPTVSDIITNCSLILLIPQSKSEPYFWRQFLYILLAVILSDRYCVVEWTKMKIFPISHLFPEIDFNISKRFFHNSSYFLIDSTTNQHCSCCRQLHLIGLDYEFVKFQTCESVLNLKFRPIHDEVRSHNENQNLLLIIVGKESIF